MFRPFKWNIIRRFGWAVASAAALSSAACSDNLRGIDDEIDREIRDRSGRLGQSAATPTRPRLEETNLDQPGPRQTDLQSANLDPADIRFSPADEKRDVASRLAGYSAAGNAAGSQTLTLDLIGAMRQLQNTGRALVSAEEQYLFESINLLIVEHAWTPQLTGSTQVGVTTTERQLDAAVYQTPLNVINQLRVTQRLPYGGTAEAAWVWNATNTLRSAVTDRYTQASTLVVGASIPLLRGAGDIAREDIINARRRLVYAARTFEQRRRELLVDLASDYFNLIEQQAVIANQERSLEFAERQAERTQALVQAGRLAEFQLGISASEVLSSRSQLANLRERFILAVERFKIKLGLSVNQAVTIAPLTFDLKEPEVTPDAAAGTALEYSLPLQNQRDQVEDQVRVVRNARNSLLPDVQLSGNVGMRTDPLVRDAGVVFDDNDFVSSAAILVNYPLDRKVERLTLRAANIRLEQSRRDFEQARDEVIIEARARVRELDLARFNLELAEQRVKIATRRREEQEIKAAEVTAQQFVETAQEIREAENARDRAVAALRTAILNFLLTTGQLRVDRDGTLSMPNGLSSSTPIEPAALPPAEPALAPGLSAPLP